MSYERQSLEYDSVTSLYSTITHMDLIGEEMLVTAHSTLTREESWRLSGTQAATTALAASPDFRSLSA